MVGRPRAVQFAFRIYMAGYVAVLGFGFLADLSSRRLPATPISPRASAIAGLVVVGAIAWAGLGGRAAVALRPSAAEIQLSLLSPTPRRESLARSIRSGLKASTLAAGIGVFVVMLVCTAQFSGLSVGTELAYLAIAGGVGVIAFAVHLLVAERRGTPLALAGVAIAATSAVDVATRASRSPVTIALDAIREDGALAVIAATYAIGGLLIRRASRDAERIEVEFIRRGADASDRALVALAGNDLRTLLVLYRSLGARAWRETPLVRLPAAVSARFPVLTRGLRGIARWRATRWVFVAATTVAAGALLGVQPVSMRTTALAALVLWALGLALNEPLAQEHDRADRLELLPNAHAVEYRHVGFSWGVAFSLLTASLLYAMRGDASVATVVGLAGSAASGATVAAAVSFRATWKPLLSSASLGLPPEVIASKIIYQLARPGVFAFACIAFWRLGASGIVLVTPGLVAMTLLVAWIATDGFQKLSRSLPWMVAP